MITAHETLSFVSLFFCYVHISQRLNDKAARDDAQSKKLAEARAEAAKKSEELHQAKLSAQVSTYIGLTTLLCNAVLPFLDTS
jgi:hypothetical protein